MTEHSALQVDKDHKTWKNCFNGVWYSGSSLAYLLPLEFLRDLSICITNLLTGKIPFEAEMHLYFHHSVHVPVLFPVQGASLLHTKPGQDERRDWVNRSG